MPVCDCTPVESFFDPRKAQRELKKFRKRGAYRWTREMLGAIEQASLPQGATLLDIGGGVGAIHHYLLERGFSHATQVDAAQAYLDAAHVSGQSLGLRSWSLGIQRVRLALVGRNREAALPMTGAPRQCWQRPIINPARTSTMAGQLRLVMGAQ